MAGPVENAGARFLRLMSSIKVHSGLNDDDDAKMMSSGRSFLEADPMESPLLSVAGMQEVCYALIIVDSSSNRGMI